MERKNEIYYMTIAKGLGIVLVVLGHSTPHLFLTEWLHRYIYLFHMSLFFLISGYFFKDKYLGTPVSFLIKRIKSLYLPFLKYNLFFFLFRNIFCNLGIYKPSEYLSDPLEWIKALLKIISFTKVEDIVAPMWFIPILFGCNILFFVLKYVFKKTGHCNLYVYSVLILMYIAAFYIENNNSITRMFILVSIGCFMYACGYLFNKYEDKVNFRPRYLIISMMLLLAMSFVFDINMIQLMLVNPVVFACSGLIGSYMILGIAKSVEKNVLLSNILMKLGKSTMEIFSLQYIGFLVVTFIQLKVLGIGYTNVSLTGIKIFIPQSVIAQVVLMIMYLAAGIIVPMTFVFIKDKISRRLYEKIHN